MIRFDRLHPEEISGTWPILETAMQFVEQHWRGLWTAEAIRRRAESGEWQIWVLSENGALLAVCGSCIVLTDAGEKWAEILFCAGAGRVLWQEKVSEFEDWARAEGCTRVRSVFRKGWLRLLPGYRATNVFVEKDL